MEVQVSPIGASLDLSSKYEAVRLCCNHSEAQSRSKGQHETGKSGIEKAAELVLRYRHNLENGVKQFVQLNR